MKNYFILMILSVVLFQVGCQKDEGNILLDIQQNSSEKNLLPLDSIPKAKRFIDRQLRNISDRNSYFSTTDIDYNQTLVAVTGYNERTYSLAINHDPSEGWIYNIVMHEKDGVIDNAKIVGIRRLTDQRILSYQYSLEEGFGSGSRSFGIRECIRNQYVLGNNMGNSGGGGSDGNNPFGGGGNSDGLGGIFYGDYGGWTGSNDSGDTGGSGGGTPGGGGGTNVPDDGECDTTKTKKIETRIVIWNSNVDMQIYEPFNPITGNGINSGNMGNTEFNGSRDLSTDCKNLLKKYGILNKNGKLDEDKLDEMLQDCWESVPDLKSMIDEMAQSNLINPCDNTQYELDAEGIELELCLTGEYSRGGLQRLMDEALEGYPHIKISKNLSTDCPQLNCILTKLLNDEGPSSDFLCDLMSKFDGSPDFIIGSGIPKTNEPDFDAKTVPSPTGKSIAIVFNKDKCKSVNGINLFESFQHELVHADFYRQLIDDYGWNGSEMTLDATFKALVVARYGPSATPDQHVLMLNQLLPDLINSLMQANGNTVICTGLETTGPCKHFRTLILNGFSKELLETQLGISLSLYSANANEYNLWKLSQPIFINLNNCK